MPLGLAHFFRARRAQDQAKDINCLRAILAGGRERESACLELYRRYGVMLKSLFLKGGVDYSTAEDMAHDLMIKVIEDCDKYYEVETFRSWLIKIANNMMTDRYRQAEIRRRLIERSLSERDSPLHLISPPACDADQAELTDCILQHFAEFEAVDPKGAVIIKLSMIEGIQDKEIAYGMNMSYDSLRQYKSKARKLLQKFLEYCLDLLGEKG